MPLMEVYQEFGNDLMLSGAGDLIATSGSTLSNQRIIRRLLTNPGDYIWEPTYGAGLGRYIGQLNTPDTYNQIKAVITSQMYLETSVSQTPPPIITLTGLPNELQGSITYTEVISGQQIVVTFNINQ